MAVVAFPWCFAPRACVSRTLVQLTFTDRKVGDKRVIEASSYPEPNRGPYPFNQPRRNQVPFTPVQVEAIRSGMNPGLTMVVGPPGTGKTDVAVQIITNLYHNFPDQVRHPGCARGRAQKKSRGAILFESRSPSVIRPGPRTCVSTLPVTTAHAHHHALQPGSQPDL